MLAVVIAIAKPHVVKLILSTERPFRSLHAPAAVIMHGTRPEQHAVDVTRLKSLKGRSFNNVLMFLIFVGLSGQIVAIFPFFGGIRRPSLRARNVWSGITKALGNETSRPWVFEAAFELSLIRNLSETLVLRWSEMQLWWKLVKAHLFEALRTYVELNEDGVDPKR